MSYPPPAQGGYGGGGYGGGAPVKSNMGLAVTALVISFLAGCVPLGIFAVVQASQANSAAQRGDTATAQQKAKSARTLSLVSFAISALAAVAVAIYIVAIINDTSTTTY
jgi:predicted metalloprotease